MVIPAYLKKLARKWPSPYVLRSQAGEFTHSLYSPNYMGNLDRAGKGPRRIMIAGKTAYPVQDLIEWMAHRITADIPSKVLAAPVVEKQPDQDAG